MFEKELVEELQKHIKGEVSVEVPPDAKLGDYAFPCFALAKEMKKAPAQIAKELAEKIKKPIFVEKIEAAGPYINFFIDSYVLAKKIIREVLAKKHEFGSSNIKKGSTYAIDYSHPNIGKPFHFGHLRSTIIGESIARILEFQGASVERLNYIGDWGTQFGKLIYAFLKWGDEKKLEEDPVNYLLELYVKFHKESEHDETLKEKGREWFAKIEQGDKEALRLWGKFVSFSIKEFKRIYEILGTEFDSYDGESFSARQVPEAIKTMKKKGVGQLDQGAFVAYLKGFEVPIILIKSDGSTTYGSRDVSAIMHRVHELNADKLLYVVGHEQALHFQQLFALMGELGHPKENFTHVSFGFYLSSDGGKLSTRKGKVILMDDVLNEAISLALKTIEQKNPDLEDKEEIARLVGVGAIKFGDLVSDRVKDITFDMNRILSFEGDTGAYLLYTHARAASVVRKADERNLAPSANADFSLLVIPAEKRLIKLISDFPKKVDESVEYFKPHILANYLLDFGRAFNDFYHSCPCLQEKSRDLILARLTLIEASRQILENGLRLLGMAAPFEM